MGDLLFDLRNLPFLTLSPQVLLPGGYAELKLGAEDKGPLARRCRCMERWLHRGAMFLQFAGFMRVTLVCQKDALNVRPYFFGGFWLVEEWG